MDKEKIIKELKQANDDLAKVLAKPAKTAEEIAAQDKAFKDAQDKVKAVDDFVTKLEGELPTSKRPEAEQKRWAEEFVKMHKTVQNTLTKIDDTAKKLKDVRDHGKDDDAGKALQKTADEASADLKKFYGQVTDAFEATFSDEKKKGILDTVKDAAGNLNYKGLIGGILGTVGGFMAGKMFGGGFFGTLFGIGLSIAGFFLGRDFANKHFGDVAKNDGTPGTKDANKTAATNPDNTKSNDVAPNTNVDPNKKVEMDPEMQAILENLKRSQANNLPSNNNGGGGLSPNVHGRKQGNALQHS